MKLKLSNTQIIILSFLVVILIGTVLLTLPISSADGNATPIIDAMFTATTSVCVTGLVVVDTFSHWSYFGQAVILFLIQCGGLGIVTLMAFIMVIMGKKVTLKNRMLLQDAFNLDTMRGLVKFLKKVLFGTLLVEGIGAVGYMFTFVPEYGLKGIWISVFNSVSAFCNAGIDIIGDSSLTPYATNIWVNIITICLIVFGGIGFIVWLDVIDVIKRKLHKEFTGGIFGRLSLHSKLAIIVTLILIFVGGILIMILEYDNKGTIGNMNFGQKFMASVFQSVTTRTAGFLTFSQKNMRDATTLLCLIMMFIGGSPVGTAGGIKTTTFALVVLSAAATAKGSEDVVLMKKTIPSRKVKKALGVMMIAVMVLFTMIIVMSVVCDGDFLDIVFEVTSAIATAGLSRNFTSTLSEAGKALIILCMYLGRIGPISLVIALSFNKSKKGLVMYPEEDITVG